MAIKSDCQKGLTIKIQERKPGGAPKK